MVWRDGVLPPEAPPFSPLLSYDLLSYGYSLLSLGLRLLEKEGSAVIARTAFEHAAEAIEAVVAKSARSTERSFHHFIAAAAYHLGRFSARAFSLLNKSVEEPNLSPCERCVAALMLRDFEAVNNLIADFRVAGTGSDETLLKELEGLSVDEIQSGAQDEAVVDLVDLALIDNFFGAMGTAILAFERGDERLLASAVAQLRIGLSSSAELNLVSQWWCHRLTIHLLGDLWKSSFHVALPLAPKSDLVQPDWAMLRKIFIAVLYARSRAEIELWPSQRDSAARALDVEDHLVVSLPTSAGKTRIAELCILACLASRKRVVFVTPLRALSAQTEITLQRTFQPLGKTVSTLYGSIGVSDIDEEILGGQDIIVSTPEKLDFALRNDPNLLDDVGLIVLDEGHMIGLGEREVRYEAQIQRLLRRADADARRIVCLSAILPDGDKLEDFVAWLTRDSANGIVQNKWRPTRLRFGEIEWQGSHARLQVSVGGERPFVPKFLNATSPSKGKRKKAFPSDQRELCLASAWRLVQDGQSVLIFCPQRRSVEPFAEAIVKLSKSGLIESVLTHDQSILSNALTIGAEWFGENHPILECLRLGVAVHHGALPTPYRREVERLLRDGVLKVTISSPTLAQGLNLSASTLIFYGLKRTQDPIEVSEFRNVVGRAGRAYIDVEGLVLYPMFEPTLAKRREWNTLVDDDGGREMESGLLRLVLTLMQRMSRKLGTRDVDKLVAYVANSAAWDFSALSGESSEQIAFEAGRWRTFVATLDTAILSSIGEQEVDDGDIETKLDEVLQSSLWARRISRRGEATQKVLKEGLFARARLLWKSTTPAQRRGYFLAGVGLDTGRSLDANAAMLNQLLVEANGAILNDNEEGAIEAITAFAKIIFEIEPFTPDPLPDHWPKLLEGWLRGKPVNSLGATTDAEILQFIENGLIYRLPWGMEAVRVRGITHKDQFANGVGMSDVELGFAVAAVETGTLNRSAAFLMRSGFNHRTAAIKAVSDGGGEFETMDELRRWIQSDGLKGLRESLAWPTVQTHEMWLEFSSSLRPSRRQVWSVQKGSQTVEWDHASPPPEGTPVHLRLDADGVATVFSADYTRLGEADGAFERAWQGLVRATVDKDGELKIEYVGPKDFF